MVSFTTKLSVENETKKNYATVKLNVPKRVTLPNGRTFIARYKKIKRSELLSNIVMRQEVEGVGEDNKARKLLTL